MEDRTLVQHGGETKLEELKKKIRDPGYLDRAVDRIAGNLTREYYLRTQKGST